MIVNPDGAQCPRLETDTKGLIRLHLPFDDGRWMVLVLGKQIPNFIEWLSCDDWLKAYTARCYISDIEGCPASGFERDAVRAEERKRRYLDMERELEIYATKVKEGHPDTIVKNPRTPILRNK